MEDLERVEAKILRLEKEIATQVDVHQVERLCSIPDVDMITAWTLLAELGTDMRVFESSKHASGWAGLCPGNYESGGRRLSNRTRKGNRVAVWRGQGSLRPESDLVSELFYRTQLSDSRRAWWLHLELQVGSTRVALRKK